MDLLKSKKIDLFVKNQNISTDTIVGEFFFNIINAVSQYEKDLISERILSGINNARKKGRIGGRPTNLTPSVEEKILELKANGTSIKKIKEECGVGTASVYKVLKAA